MDIYCPICTEPWELDTLHEVAKETHTTFNEVRKDFQARGCIALGTTACTPANNSRADKVGALYDLLGDDIDGAAALMEDFDLLGMMD